MEMVAEEAEAALRFEHVVEPGGEDLAEVPQHIRTIFALHLHYTNTPLTLRSHYVRHCFRIA